MEAADNDHIPKNIGKRTGKVRQTYFRGPYWWFAVARSACNDKYSRVLAGLLGLTLSSFRVVEFWCPCTPRLFFSKWLSDDGGATGTARTIVGGEISPSLLRRKKWKLVAYSAIGPPPKRALSRSQG